jgi:ABC-type transport system involved in cytochrome c biogenesis permease subunit
LFSKPDGKSLGTYLVSQLFIDDDFQTINQPVDVNGHAYDLSLRFKRLYHPYSLTLKKFDLTHYVGTTTAKNYSSLVDFQDPRFHVNREVAIWMNNPLRYAGTTFYQQSYNTDANGKPVGTILQVVTNPSWMTPYVACMLVAIGMLAHFGTMLIRFLRRRQDEVDKVTGPTPYQRDVQSLTSRERDRIAKGRTSVPAEPARTLALATWFPLAVLIVFGGYVASMARMPKSAPSEAQIYEFGKLPVVYEGRVKPYDTLARNTLQILSGRQEVGVINDKGEITSHFPAIRWLLDVISDADGAADERVFRVENLDLLSALDLKPRPQFWRYSYNEIAAKIATDSKDAEPTSEVHRQIALADEVPEKERSLFQNKVLELKRKLNIYTVLVTSFRSPPLSTEEKQIAESWQRSQDIIAQLNAAGAPHSVPPVAADGSWTILMQAELDYLRNRVTKQPLNPATVALTSMLSAYSHRDVTTFNKSLGEYRTLLGKYEQSLNENAKQLLSSGVAKSEIMSQTKANFEVFFNQFSPFYYAAVLYVFAFVLGIFSWIGWTQPLRRASIWLLWLTFALHTFALVARIYISGRPPITNLYSTAIFIGWAVVLMALVFESIYKLGLGNIVASVVGFLTLLLAYNLSLDGDTFIVLQAVLDTQFWLATHVVTINLGYAATYAAGAWGIIYIFFAHVFPVLDTDARHKLLRTLYGALCFAIFFSFVGTVLGGLWADDSWGRFWGWDPKENGAVLIVLWCAIILHARWGGFIRQRGLMIMALFGNIVTSFSWFGVNMLGVGLHSYGFMQKAFPWLVGYMISQLALMTIAAMPLERWRSFRTASAPAHDESPQISPAPSPG